MERLRRDLFPGLLHWTLLLVLTLFVAGWVALDGRFSMAWGTMAPTAGIVVLGVFVGSGPLSQSAAGQFIARLRTPLVGIAFITLGFTTLRLLNHLLMSLPFPLADERLMAWDRLFGFDWTAYANFVAQRPLLIWLFDVTYTRLDFLAVAALMILFFMGRSDRAREFIELVLITGVVCMTLAAMFPAEAAVARLATPEMMAAFGERAGVYHLADLNSLRSGGEHVFNVMQLPGLATFPSFHTAAGILLVYALRGQGWLFWAAFAYAAVMIASTPIIGGHYFVDLIAGAALVAVVIAVHRLAVRPRERGAALVPQS